MHISYRYLPLLSLFTTIVVADLLGPKYVPPTDLSSSQSLVPASWQNVTSTIETYLKNGNQAPSSSQLSKLSNLTFSLGMFSLHDPNATQLQYHHTGPEVANSPNGTHKVDADTIYRVASVTKVFTVLAALLEVNSTDWERPLSDIIPGLANFAAKSTAEASPIYRVDWSKVTISALAAQIAGVPRDDVTSGSDLFIAALTAELTGTNGSLAALNTEGLPPISPKDPLAYTSCVNSIIDGSATCSESSFVQDTSIRYPSFLPWTTPGYADDGFAMLGLAIAHATGKDIHQIYQESIFGPLGMTGSNSSTPPVSEWQRSAIVGDAVTSGFALDAGVNVATGGLLSTTRDLAVFGNAILNSTILPPDQTRKWLKPTSHTARLQASVGRPWEIFRYIHPCGAVTDIYTKFGDSGSYSASFVLIPDYDLGFSVLTAGTVKGRFAVVAAIADLITETVVPAIAAETVVESGRKYAGTYTSSVQGMESSLTIAINQTVTAAPGLVITSWKSNGTDVLPVLANILGAGPYRLVPSIADSKNGKQAFRLVTSTDAPNKPVVGLFSGNGIVSPDWLELDSLTYGGIALALFVFDVESDGKAIAVSPAALRISLKKS
ncbi:beta-lactamase/transpeptidase-like protein [Microthyrium microscopicum]|uniref:Beta-lactamase/transpeptidase-like protein n=1 Tax=Microthyrium microscopicum TaxID=703497 RepID=A0A6A6U063_9PEZI|nr:beta-lactamase/transpeptidase-like protein [Microthyrium microscopicum]